MSLCGSGLRIHWVAFVYLNGRLFPLFVALNSRRCDREMVLLSLLNSTLSSVVGPSCRSRHVLQRLRQHVKWELLRHLRNMILDSCSSQPGHSSKQHICPFNSNDSFDASILHWTVITSFRNITLETPLHVFQASAATTGAATRLCSWQLVWAE